MVKNSRLLLLLIAPGIYLYSLLIGSYLPDKVEPAGLRELFTGLFLIGGLLPFYFKEWSLKYYGVVVFALITTLAQYLVYTTYLNNFEIHYLLGTYVVLFGGILLLVNRYFISVFVTTSMASMLFAMNQATMSDAFNSAILLSLSTIFLYSFIIQNGFIQHKEKLQLEKFNLESKILDRNKTLEIRANELSQKNRELEEFAYVVSHDLKRPLRNIHSLAVWTQEDLDRNQRQSAIKNLELLKEQITQMDMLVKGILEYSLGAEKTSSKKNVNTDELVDRIIASTTEPMVTLIKESKLPHIFIDETQLLQVFQNLIQNAIAYNDKENILIKIGCIEQEDRFQFYIKDNGMGIAEEHHQRIFKLFQRLEVETTNESTGIGLALVKKIIDKQGGKIYLESELGMGSTFYFTLLKKFQAV